MRACIRGGGASSPETAICMLARQPQTAATATNTLAADAISDTLHVLSSIHDFVTVLPPCPVGIPDTMEYLPTLLTGLMRGAVYSQGLQRSVCLQ